MPEITDSKTGLRECWHRKDRVKRCITCGEEKLLSEFYAFAYTTSQGKRSTRYESRCKDCQRAKSKKRHKAVRSQALEYMKRRRQEKIKERKEYAAAYQKSEHGRRMKAKAQRLRKARMRSGDQSTDPRIAALYQEAMDWEKKLAACVVSDKPLELKMHVDHIIPLSKGGQHVFENLQILDALENMRKGARLDYA